MSPISWLKVFLIIEKISGLYRNYSRQSKFKKCLIIIQIFVQNFLYALVITIVLFHNEEASISDMYQRLPYCVFAGTTYLIYLVSVVYAIIYSHIFASYFMTISRVYETLKPLNIYSVKTTRYWASLVYNLFASVTMGCRVIEIYHKYFVRNDISAFPVIASEVITRATIIFEHFVLYIVVMTIVDLSKTLLSLMSEAQQRVEKCSTSEAITEGTISGWVELYQELVNCCDKVAVCFGGQYIVLVACTILHLVSLTYYAVCSKVARVDDVTEVYKLAVIVFIFIVMMLMPIVATQMASNQWAKCHRAMARLHNNMIDDVDSVKRKLIKDFIRLIKKSPLQIRFMSKVPVGFFLLPAILSVIVNNVIVMLQFNHII